MSAHLKAFLADYIEWVDAGASDGKPFRRDEGLCRTLEDWMFGQGSTQYDADEAVFGLMTEFESDGLSRYYPFGGATRYHDDRLNYAMHLNEARIAWVRAKVTQYAIA